ncbi:trafficking protein particle complex subunit 8-like isoform X1 [Acipenser oxyrinchus oxyrinchus]|uniref:Trafficking protein particle complex subunit 8-like isoform X1 n=1 Tax=Acipenser oxyrinchus oxyrinchus TaxID=40147 RepID=A0AAD8LPT5_ACIOX|nr:trafficking protein particle complex subunit 8-like isoform X1 [Acipenser oxyrinchus oxyrinchus]
MAQCLQSVQEFIQDSFVPMVAVLCSEDAEQVTRKNNLNFSELVRPFCRLTSEGHMRDPNNQIQVIKNLKIHVSNIVTQPPQPAAIRKMLSEVVSVSQPAEGLVANVITAGDYDLNISDRSVKASVPWYNSWKETQTQLNTSKSFTATTPWFEAYRESFFQSMPASDHDFLNHYLACMLVVSSNEPKPVEQFLKLSQEQHRIQHSSDYTYPKWFIPNTLKYYVLLHDISEEDEQRADSVYEEMKQRYGTQGCYLLKINSQTLAVASDEQIPDPWSQYLQKSNLQNQELFEDGTSVLMGSKNTENNVSAPKVDGIDPSVKADGVPYNFETHPLQLDHPSDPGGRLDGFDTLKNTVQITDGKKPCTVTTHGACLTLNDHDRIRQFIQEFTFRGLLPHIEKSIRQLNDQLVSRKGLSRSLFSATKKWFSGGKVPEKSIAELKNTAGLLYPPEAPELQIRKLADLCFLVQHYDLAYSCYHTAKKDFLNDQAMLYAAGALEMAAVSAFLQPGAPRPYPAHYMDTAIQTYRDVCKNMVLAERCALLSAEILKSQAKYSEAATLLIRMTSEDSDLRSALLLEQAAHCFINMRSPMLRKFAFHMILAGHRFSKAGQKRHALRCYCQAMQVYKGKGWSLAEDHINFTIGRQSFTLKQLDNAVSAFRHILINDSKQTASQQGAFLREYLYVYKNVSQLSPDSPLPHLPLPCIQSSATRVFFGHDRRLAEGEKQAATHVSLDQEFDSELSQQWKELEEQVVAVVNRGAIPVNFQPTQYCLNSQTDNFRFPLAVVEEPIIVEVVFRNPLKVPLLLTDLSLLGKFQSKDFGQLQNREEPKSNEKDAHGKATFNNEFISTDVILEFSMGSEETKVARLKLLPHQTGELHILGVVYNLGTVPYVNVVDGTDPSSGLQGDGNLVSNGMSVRGRQDLEIQGPRLNNTKEEKTSVKHGPDRRLDPIITPPMPLLEVFFINFPTGLLCGEIRKAHVEFVNVSKVLLTGLKVASKHPEFFTFGSNTAALTPQSPKASENCSAYKTIVTDSTSACTALTSLVSPVDFGMSSRNSSLGVIDIPLPDSVLLPGASIQLPLWLRGPDKEGVHEINFLFYYESANKVSKLSHRVLRHTAVICTSRSLSVRATVCRSNTFQDEEDGRNGNMLVFVDVENINTNEGGVQEFHIVQVSSSSKQWRFQKCINPSEDKDAKLTSRERGKLCFKATTCKYQDATSGALGKYTFADIILGNEQIISATTPCADFFFRSCQSSESEKTLSNGYTSFVPARWPTDNVGKIVRKCSEVDLNIIVLWKAYVVEDNKQLILEGQLHVALQTIGKEACSLSQKQEAQEMVLLKLIRPEQPPLPARPSVEQLSHLIKTSLHYPESYDHPFTHKSLCVVPVTLMLSNCSQAGVDVIIDLRHKAISPETLEVHGSFTWLGQTQFKLQLKAQEIHKLQLKACFIHAGVYNLGTARVFAKLTDQGSMCETSQQNSMPALIIINNI